MKGGGSGRRVVHLGCSGEQRRRFGNQAEVVGTGLDQRRDADNCCYAIQDKSWVRDPDGNEWEVFVVLKDNLPESNMCCSSDSAPIQSRTCQQAVANEI